MPPEFAVEIAAVDVARDAAYAELRAANARGVTRSDIDAFTEAMDRVSVRCEELRRTYFPRRHQLFVAGGLATIFSKTGRATENVWTRESRDE
ncbi:hypothetical protein [Nocardia fluminea]|uniref:hypothetical protein n=1 Tax=Nocardia fluminea TaxID=134984 RepID=UPI003414ABFC